MKKLNIKYNTNALRGFEIAFYCKATNPENTIMLFVVVLCLD